MNKAYFAPLVSLPRVITAPGEYLTRAGERVTICKVSPRQDFGCEGIYAKGGDEAWHKTGRLFAGRECRNDIVGSA